MFISLAITRRYKKQIKTKPIIQNAFVMITVAINIV